MLGRGMQMPNFDKERLEIEHVLAALSDSLVSAAGPLETRGSSRRARILGKRLMIDSLREAFDRPILVRGEYKDTVHIRMLSRNIIAQIDNIESDFGEDRALLGHVMKLTPLRSYEGYPPTPGPLLKELIAAGVELSVGRALKVLRFYLRELSARANGAPMEQLEQIRRLQEIVPKQQIAPAQFGIVNNRIVVVDRPPTTEEADRRNISAAHEHIQASGQELASTLDRSNWDKKLINSVKALHSQIVAGGNIIKIGLANMGCSIMAAQYQHELPDAVVAMLKAYTSDIAMYVAQFPEWEQFTDKAAAIRIDEDDVASVSRAVGEVIDTLSAHPELADPEVPRTIAFIRELLAEPGKSSKRAAFAMIRTIENLVSSIVQHSINFLRKTAEKAVDVGSSAASKIIVGLLSVALVGAVGIGPAAVNAGVPWIQQAAEIVQRQIETLARP